MNEESSETGRGSRDHVEQLDRGDSEKRANLHNQTDISWKNPPMLHI